MKNKTLPKPFKNPLITDQHYVDVLGWTQEEIKLAADIFALSTGVNILDTKSALSAYSSYRYLHVTALGDAIFVDCFKGDLSPLTKEQVFLLELDSVNDFPDFGFKLSCGDRPEVRQWLKDNGCVWNEGNDLTKELLNSTFLYVEDRIVRWDEKDDWLKVDTHLPIIEPIIKVTGFTIHESEKKRKETLDLIKQKKDTVSAILKEIEELEKEV